MDFVNYNRTNQTAKADEGKLQISLVPTQIIRDIAEVRMYGNKKYHDPDNWKTVEKQRYVDALLRHLLAYLDDPTGVDSESGIPHYKHAACNMAFICAMEGDFSAKMTPPIDAEYRAREILADIAGMDRNTPSKILARKIIFGDEDGGHE